MDTMKGYLLDMGRDVVEVGVDEATPGIDGRRSYVRRQSEVLQLHRQG